MDLSQDELSFSLLIDSHNLACQWLSNLALAAIKYSSPTDWKDKVCACFAEGVKRHVHESLENSRPLTDVYAVCKIVECRINDIAKFCGEELLDPRKKERFSLQVQGIKTARNLAFHDEFVSVREVCSSIDLVTSLRDATREKGNLFAEAPEELLALDLSENARKLMSTEAGSTYSIPLSARTVGRSLLYSSFREFRKRFSEYFEATKRMATALGKDTNDDSDLDHNSIPALIKAIRAKIHYIRLCEVSKKRVAGGSSQYTKNDCFVLCKRLLAARNTFAHNREQSFPEIRQTLIDIEDSLALFGLYEGRVTYSISRLNNILDDDLNCMVRCNLMKLLDVENCQEEEQQRERILRPRSKLFIGKTRELSSITSILRSQRFCPERRAVLVFGQSGIGKTFLATEVAHSLSKIYPQQTWLTCSDWQELQEEISHRQHHFLHEEMPATGTFHKHAQMRCDCLGMERVPKQNTKLFILDDVSLSTVSFLNEKLLRSPHSFILTAKSTAVKEALQRTHLSLCVIHLQPFSTAESLKMIDAKSTNVAFRSLPGYLALVKRALNNVLGNLPLCVSIYSSLLRFAAKNSSSHDMSVISSDSLLLKWKGIEEQFGDNLHVRGLTGVIQSSENYLKDYPFVVFLLTKICLCNSESIPWDILCPPVRKPELTPSCLQAQISTRWSRELLSGLLGVIDWLFSPEAEAILKVCRDALEELGLVSWEKSTATIHIHRLTLQRTREVLEERSLFLRCLADNAVGKSTDEDAKVNKYKEVELISKGLSDELQSELFTQTFRIMLDVSVSINHVQYNEPCTRGNDLLRVWTNVMQIRDSSLDYIKEIWPAPKMFAGIGMIPAAARLWDPFEKFKHKIVPPHSDRELLHHWRIQLYSALDDFLMPRKDLLNTAAQIFEKIEKMMGHCLPFRHLDNQHDFLNCKCPQCQQRVSTYLLAALCHCVMADILEFTCPAVDGRCVRKTHMRYASQIYRILRRLPNTEEVLGLVAKRQKYETRDNPDLTQEDWYCELLNDRLKFTVWSYMVHFEINDSIVQGVELHNSIVQIVLSLISYSQQTKWLTIRTVKKLLQKEHPSARIMWQLPALDFHFVIVESFHEAWLWELIGKKERSLRSFIETLRVIEACLHNFNSFDKHNCLHGFCGNLIMLVLLASLNAYDLGNFAAGAKLTKQLAELLNSSYTHDENVESVGYLDSTLSGCHNIGGCIPLFEGVSLVYNKKDFSGALSQFRTFLENFEFQPHYGFLFFMILLPNITICALLGEATTTETLSMIKRFSKNYSLLADGKTEIDETVAAIHHLLELSEPPLETISQHFNEARDACKLHVGDSAQKAALKCFRTVVARSEELAKCKFKGFLQILNSILIDAASFLHQAYCNEKKFESAEWFLKFQYECAGYFGWSFLVGKYGSEYASFLYKRGQLIRALTLSGNIESFLVDKFGNDYLEWLPDAAQVQPTKCGNINVASEELLKDSLRC